MGQQPKPTAPRIINGMETVILFSQYEIPNSSFYLVSIICSSPRAKGQGLILIPYLLPTARDEADVHVRYWAGPRSGNVSNVFVR